jgi:hypothetical protein
MPKNNQTPKPKVRQRQSVSEPIFSRMDVEVLDKMPDGRWKNKRTGKIWKNEDLPPTQPPGYPKIRQLA